MPSKYKQEFTPPPDIIMPTAEDLQEIAIEADREAGEIGPSQMIRGASVFFAGVFITVLTYAAAVGGGIYVIAYGAVMGGLADFVIGFSNWRRGRNAKSVDTSINPK